MICKIKFYINELKLLYLLLILAGLSQINFIKCSNNQSLKRNLRLTRNVLADLGSNSNNNKNSNNINNNQQYYNHIPYSEIKNRLELFPSLNLFKNIENSNEIFLNELNKINGFKEILVDSSSESIFVGARNYLIKFSYKNDSLKINNFKSDIVQWQPTGDVIDECKKYLPEKSCQNYLRVIILDINSSSVFNQIENEPRLLVCGTYANRPLCTWRNKDRIDEVIEYFDGIGKIPSNPESSSSYIKLDNGDVYFGTSINYEQGMKADYLIDRSLGSSKQLRTDQYNSNWLNDPVFVASLTIGDYVYFFIRETAIEYMNCGQKIYSRVVRLCKHDEGIENVEIWRSFEKARIDCSVSSIEMNSQAENAQYPYYFDEIQNVYYDAKKKLIYAIFSTPANGIKGSAVCVYDVSSLEAAFNGPFKHQKSKESIWQPYNESIETYKCGESFKSNLPKTKYIDANKFQLKHLSIQPLYKKPILVLPNKRLLKIAVDTVMTKHQNNIDVLFIASEYNTVMKYAFFNSINDQTKNILSDLTQPTVCLLEEVEIFDSDSKYLINSINNLILLDQFDRPTRHLLIATSINLIKMPVANCEVQTNYFSCLSLMDPYCVWDSKMQKCELIFNLNEPSSNHKSSLNSQYLKHSPNIHQHQINSCPSTNIPVDGGFSEWSSWISCMSKSGERCKCRMRTCTSPEPRNGGKTCDETQSIEILNCEIHGGWTLWSAWSACQGGAATTCDPTNKSPAVRTRFRTCTNPEPKFNGRVCVGLDQEEEVCTSEMINPCASTPNNQWMSWGAWEECSKPCGEGFQMRRRLCSGKNCIGCNQEWRTCNSEPCKERVENVISEWDLIEYNKESRQKLEKRIKFTCKYDNYLEVNNLNGMDVNSTIEYRICEDEKYCRSIGTLKELGVFSEWSDWSECNECGDEQFRSRRCSVINSCFGHDREMRECTCTNEKLNDGWGCWSDFTPCSVSCGKGIQKRSRRCLRKYSEKECPGLSEEIGTCYNTNCSSTEMDVNDGLFASITGQSNNIVFTLTHLIIVSVLTFLLGSLTILLIIYIGFKRKTKYKNQKISFCCCVSGSAKSKLNSNDNNDSDKQLSSSLDHNSLATDTATTDGLHNDNKLQYCSNRSDSSTNSNISNHSKEYFTIGNRYDPSGLSSLLNDVIPDDDDEIIVNTNPNGGGTLKKNKAKLSLPNKSFNTYINSKDTSKNSRNVSIGMNGPTNNVNMTTLSTSANTNQRYSNYSNNLNGSIRSSSINKNNQRTSFAFSMRTNLDQEEL